jgi:hypothetical protein
MTESCIVQYHHAEDDNNGVDDYGDDSEIRS